MDESTLQTIVSWIFGDRIWFYSFLVGIQDHGHRKECGENLSILFGHI